MSATPDGTVIDDFRALHESGCFVLPNPWDIGSAIYLHQLGYRALATTSAGFAFSRGLPDSVTALTLDSVLDHLREIATATPLPVTADFQQGYAVTPEGVAGNVGACLRTGVAGLSIEDGSGDPGAPLFDRGLAIERIRAAVTARDGAVRDGAAQDGAARDSAAPGAVLTARCEAWLVGDTDPERTAIDRLVAYAEAGADCLYAPGVRDPDVIARIVREVAPQPVNVLISAPSPDLSLRKLEDLGVRRISVGSAMARVAWGAFAHAARAIVESGRFDSLENASPFEKLNRVFESRDEQV